MLVPSSKLKLPREHREARTHGNRGRDQQRTRHVPCRVLKEKYNATLFRMYFQILFVAPGRSHHRWRVPDVNSSTCLSERRHLPSPKDRANASGTRRSGQDASIQSRLIGIEYAEIGIYRAAGSGSPTPARIARPSRGRVDRYKMRARADGNADEGTGERNAGTHANSACAPTEREKRARPGVRRRRNISNFITASHFARARGQTVELSCASSASTSGSPPPTPPSPLHGAAYLFVPDFSREPDVRVFDVAGYADAKTSARLTRKYRCRRDKAVTKR